MQLSEFSKLQKFREFLIHSDPDSLSKNPWQDELLVRVSGAISIFYAPFDYVNLNARICIVGLTPGRFQAGVALATAARALQSFKSLEDAAFEAKLAASFSGPMRQNLIALLDYFRVQELLNISTCAELFGSHSNLVQFTSVLRYPVTVSGENYSGNPLIRRSPFLTDALFEWFGKEVGQIPNAVFVPLGTSVTAAFEELIKHNLVDSTQVLSGLPHPSGANNERIKYVLGLKSGEECSLKTNTQNLDEVCLRLRKKMEKLLSDRQHQA